MVDEPKKADGITVRIVSISGTQGSGKTTLIRELVARIGATGKQAAAIVNEAGEVDYDQDFVQAYRLAVRRLRGGCVGCSLATNLVASIKEFRRSLNPDFLFIEPSEMVVTRELRNVSAMGLRDVSYEIGPFITLVDGPAFEFSWQERRALLLGQITNADLVAVSRADLLEPRRLEDIVSTLKGYCNGVLGLSARLGLGMDEVVEALGPLQPSSGRTAELKTEA